MVVGVCGFRCAMLSAPAARPVRHHGKIFFMKKWLFDMKLFEVGQHRRLSLLKFIHLYLTLCEAVYSQGTNCSRGYFRSANFSSDSTQSKCLQCPVGTYQPANATSCTFCPSNSTSLPASTSMINCTCNYGYKKNSNGSCVVCKLGTCYQGYYVATSSNFSVCIEPVTCVPCLSGKYQLTNSSSCTSCPVNSTSLSASTSINNCTCNAGYFKSIDGNCTLCKSGTYKSSPGPGLCLPCSPGSVSVLQATACACSPGYRAGSLSPTAFSAGSNCEYPTCHFSQIYSDFTGFFCNLRYQNYQKLWWMIAPELPYSGIQLTFLEFETELQSDFVTVYFCVSADCCGYSTDAPPSACWARTPVAKSGRIRPNASAPADNCGRRPLPQGLSNPIRSLSSTVVLKVVFASDFSVALGGFAAKWESIDPPCVACSTGSYKDTVGNTPCTPCPEGKYSAVQAATACVNCSRFSESRSAGSAACTCIQGCSSFVQTPSPPYKKCSELSRTEVWYNASSGYICYMFPITYPTNQDLWWNIVSPHPNAAIYLVFGDNNPDGNWTFHTETQYDYVTVYECSDEACDPATSRKLTRHSGTTPPDPVWSLTGFMRLEFHSDISDGFPGFLAAWQIHPDVDSGEAERCGRCPAGSFKEVRGPSDCIQCADGFYSDSRAATACQVCTENHTYTSQDKTDRCSCNAGYYLNDTADAGPCLACPAGTFKNVVSDSVGCTPCPNSTNSPEGSAMCACWLGYHALPDANQTELPLALTPIAPYIVMDQLPIPQYCPPLEADWDKPAILTDPSALVCRLDPLEREARRWIIKPALPNAGVQLFFTNFFDISDVDGFVSVFTCKDESCKCYESGRCDSLQNPTGGSAPPALVVSSTGIMLVEFCTNCSSEGNTLIVSDEQVPNNISKLIGSGFIAYYQSFIGDNCERCAPGTYSGAPGPAPCTPCTDGYYIDFEGASACKSCPATYTSISDEGSTYCRCAIGYFLNNKTKACDACPAGTYSVSTGCAKCPQNSGSQAHSELCVCNAGYEWSLPLIHSDPVPEGTLCKIGCQTSACNGLKDQSLQTPSGVICKLNYGNNEDVGWVIQPTEPNNGMVLTFTLLKVESGYDNVSIFACRDISCYHWNVSYMLYLSSQNSTGTQDPLAVSLFSVKDSWTASDDGQLPAPIETEAKVIKVFFASDPSNSDPGFSLHWEKRFGKNCTACLEGTYKAIQGTSSCIPCPAGTYSSSQNSTSCAPCSPNYYSEIPQSTSELNCRKCPGGSFSRAGTSRKGDCACFPGDYLDLESDSCVGCPAGSFKSTVGTFQCTNCPVNSYSMQGSGEIMSCLCNAGFSGNISSISSVCSACPVDTYKYSPGPAACLPCSAGSYSKTGSTAASDCICSAGYESVSGNFSSIPPFSSDCPKDRSMLSALSGIVCHLNYESNEHEWWTISPLQGGTFGTSPLLLTFTTLDTELYLDRLDIYSCSEPGCFSSQLIASFSGNSLPTPIYTTTGTLKLAFFSDDSVQFSGWSAYWQTELTGCAPCLPGSYKFVKGPSKCVECDEGSYTVAGNSAFTSCHSCPLDSWSPKMSAGINSCLCNSGFFRAFGSNCSACLSGTYKPFVGNSDCFRCERGTYWTGQGATSHRVCSSCGLNSYSFDLGSVVCECNAGYSGNHDACEACWEGKYNNISGMSVCVECAAGLYSDVKGSSFCMLCAPGKYSSNSGATSEETCIPCKQNSMSPVGSTSYQSCLCNLGFYQSNETSCIICPAGTYSSMTSTAACSLCGEGKYSSILGAYYETACNACPENSNSITGSVDLLNCSCNPGFFLESYGGCQACAVGKYKSAPGANSCVDCEAVKSTGQLAATSVLDCNSCGQGMFWDEFECKNCLAGKYSAKINAVSEKSCLPCSPGTFNNKSGASACNLCGEFEFAPLPGTEKCVSCPAHSVSTGAGCECRFPFTGVVTNYSGSCTDYFNSDINWMLAPAGTSCYKACQALNTTCNNSISIDSTEKLLNIANRTSTRCEFVTSSKSHLAPHRYCY